MGEGGLCTESWMDWEEGDCGKERGVKGLVETVTPEQGG